MQKCSQKEYLIQYYDPIDNEEFPMCAFTHEQKEQNLKHLHFHRGIEIGYCHSGSGIFCIDKKLFSFSHDDICIIFFDQPHIAQSPSEAPSFWDYMNVDAEKMFADMEQAQISALSGFFRHEISIPNIISKARNEDIYTVVRLLFDEVYHEKPYKNDSIKSLLWTLFTKLSRLGMETKKTDISESERLKYKTNYDKIAPAIGYLSSCYNEDISMERLANLCYLSKTHFRRTFKQVMGCTPFDYLTKIRMKMAASLLRCSSTSVSNIGMNLGYQNISSFNRQFKEYYQMTPLEYRNKK